MNGLDGAAFLNSTLATGDNLEILLELSGLEADGFPVRWPHALTTEQLLRVRERVR